MNEALFEIKRADDTLDTGIFGNSTQYAYDYWTSHVPAGDYDQIYEILVAQDGGNIYFVTGQYPVDDLKKAESPIVAVLDSLAVFPAEGASSGLGALYSNERFAYSVSYPADWQMERMDDGSGCRISRTGDSSELLVNVTVFGEDNQARLLPVERLEKYAEMEASGTGHQLQRESTTLVTRSADGADYAVDYWSVESAAGVLLHDYVMYVTKGDRIYAILASYPASLGDEIDPIVSAMMDSFKVLD
jgi:hypothetical protein